MVISGVKSMNSQMSHMTLKGCTNVAVRNIKLVAPGNSPNTDGFGVQSSTGITLTGSTIQTGDDCVSIGPGSRNFLISKLNCGPGHGVRYVSHTPSILLEIHTCTNSYYILYSDFFGVLL